VRFLSDAVGDQEIFIPASTVVIDDMELCRLSVTVAADNPRFMVETGYLYLRDPLTLFCVPNAYSGQVRFPCRLRKFDKTNFEYQNHIRAIAFDPDSEMTELPTMVFWSCRQIKEFTFPPKIRTIGGRFFDFDHSIIEKFAIIEPNRY
jgi:hypothetical protein